MAGPSRKARAGPLAHPGGSEREKKRGGRGITAVAQSLPPPVELPGVAQWWRLRSTFCREKDGVRSGICRNAKRGWERLGETTPLGVTSR
jgi:hypothetical protein